MADVLDRYGVVATPTPLPRTSAGDEDKCVDAQQIVVASRGELAAHSRWAEAFAHERKDSRYYDVVDRTIAGFDYRYFILMNDKREPCAIQPFFLHDQDLLAGLGGRMSNLLASIRKVWPRFMRLRTLMIGCAAGEAHLDAKDDESRQAAARLLLRDIIPHARAMRAPLVVFKEFPARYRDAFAEAREQNFTRVPSLPMTRMSIAYASFDELMRRAVSRATRKDWRRKFKATSHAATLELSVVTDVSDIIDEIYPLYMQVYQRSALQFEQLTKEYLCELGRLMPDRVRYFVWRQNGRIVAFNLCMLHGDAIHDEYIGLDYEVALDLHLYHYTMRDIVNWGIAHGCRWYCSNSLNYDPKLHLRSELMPLDLYVRHISALPNMVLKLALPLLEPTRYDKTLRKFANYQDLWGAR